MSLIENPVNKRCTRSWANFSGDGNITLKEIQSCIHCHKKETRKVYHSKTVDVWLGGDLPPQCLWCHIGCCPDHLLSHYCGWCKVCWGSCQPKVRNFCHKFLIQQNICTVKAKRQKKRTNVVNTFLKKNLQNWLYSTIDLFPLFYFLDKNIIMVLIHKRILEKWMKCPCSVLECPCSLPMMWLDI